MSSGESTYQELLLKDRYAQAALSVGELKHPELKLVAVALMVLDERRFSEKGKRMGEDHLKQEARRLVE